MSQLGLGLSLSKNKGAVPFNPLSLDPYLLFDSQLSMEGTLEATTLDLDPSVPSSLDVITAVRAGVATYTDASGLIQSATANTVRVDHTQGAELTPTKFQNIGYTDFSQWTSSNSTFNSGQITSPDGTLNGSSLQINSGGFHYITLSSSHSIGDSATFSCFVKSPSQKLTWGGATANGTDAYSYEDVGNGWYRQILTRTFSATGSIQPMFSEAQAGSDLFYIYGPQLEEGTTASSFVANTTGSPKFITGATYGPRVPMMLIEPSATNLVTHSEDFSQWISENATIESDVIIISPSGSQDVSKMVASNSVERQGVNKLQTQGGDLAFSVFAKKAEYDVIQLTDAVNASFYVNFNLTSGTIGSYAGYTPKIEPAGNGWFRCSVTFNSTPINKVRLTISEQDNDGRLGSFAGNGTDGLYLWGAQLEAGSVATSYIQTSGGNAAARTRAADNLSITGSAFTDFFNSGGDGTFYAEFTTRTITDATVYLLAGHSSTQRYMYSTSQASLSAYDGSGGVTYTGYIQTTLNRVSISYNATHKEGSLNGSTVSNVTSTGDLRDSTRLSIGQSWSSTAQLNGHIKRLIYWPNHSDSL